MKSQPILFEISNFLKEDGRVKSAWIFGSFARGEETSQSDLDLMIKFSNDLKISLFDMADISYKLENLVKRKIDLVEEGCLSAYALETAKKDIIKIYG